MNNNKAKQQFSELISETANSLKVHDTSMKEMEDFIVLQKVENLLDNISVSDAFSLVKELSRESDVIEHQVYKDMLVNMAMINHNVKHFIAETVHSNLQ